jgi:sialate O-acetylesterase
LTLATVFALLPTMMKRTFLSVWVVISLFGLALNAVAQLQLPSLFSDNMVLQQGVPVAIWGWADEGDVVTVKFRGQKISATTHNLKWSLKLRALKAGGPDTLAIATKTKTL